MQFLHELSDIKQLFEVVAQDKQVLPVLVEKDYWLMHGLWIIIISVITNNKIGIGYNIF